MLAEITVFRVRKSFKDIKSQKGAYFTFYPAVKRAIKTKCNVYDNNGRCLFTATKKE